MPVICITYDDFEIVERHIVDRHRSFNRATLAIELFVVNRKCEHVLDEAAGVGEKRAMNLEVDIVNLINRRSV